jgi:putative endonuclease
MDRKQTGALGEQIAVEVLRRRGVVVLDRNVVIGSGELDLIVRCGARRAAVEVRTVRGELRMDERFPYSKRRQVRDLASAMGISRVDFVGVALHPDRLEVHWLRDVSPD